MTFDEVLRAARKSPAVAFDQFIRRYDEPGKLHIFFEGPDDSSFYSNFIALKVERKRILSPYICGNKKQVYETHKKVINRLNTEVDVRDSIRVLFFVDCDASFLEPDEYDPTELIYVTDFYSIENYLVTMDVFQRVWEDYFYFPDGNTPDFNAFSTLFETALGDFHRLMRPVMAWIFAARRCKLRPNLDQIELDSICKITDQLTLAEHVKRKYQTVVDALERMCGVPSEPETYQFASVLEKQFEDLNPKQYIRGKFEIWFFSKFIKRLAERFQADSSIKFRFRNSSQIEENQIIQSLGPRAEPPKSLIAFLDLHLSSF